MECILTLAGFYCFTIGFSFTYSHTHTPIFTSFLRSVTNNEGQGIKPPTHGKSEPPLEPQLLQKKPTFPQKMTSQLTSFSSSFFLLSSSISFLRSARWRARASMASERGRESERMTRFSSVQSSDWSCTRFFLTLFILNTNTSALMPTNVICSQVWLGLT